MAKHNPEMSVQLTKGDSGLKSKDKTGVEEGQSLHRYNNRSPTNTQLLTLAIVAIKQITKWTNIMKIFFLQRKEQRWEVSSDRVKPWVLPHEG